MSLAIWRIRLRGIASQRIEVIKLPYNSALPFPKMQSVNDNSPTPQLSRRAQRMLANPPLPEYLLEHFVRADSPYDSETNVDGYIPLSVAENLLQGDSLLERLQQVDNVSPEVLAYDAMVGSQRFREQLAQFLGRTFLGRRFDADQLAVLNGAGSVLEILFHQLCDPGDGVLVPTPSYAGFWADLETRNELHIVPVPTFSRDGFRLTPDLLDQALAQSPRPIKALLFTSPNNPLGRTYSREEVEEVIAWSRSAGIHLVVDEIYAFSVFGDRPFTSCAQILPRLGDAVHIVWAFSKDFGASGLRCGVLVSENSDLLQAVDGLAYWAATSGHTQWLLGELIADQPWVDTYLTQNRQALGGVYERTTQALDRAGISYFTADAGFFLVCDLRPYLESSTWEAEQTLWKLIIQRANLNLTPGQACRNAEPGFFRLCFAAVPPAAVEIGVERLARVLESQRKGDLG